MPRSSRFLNWSVVLSSAPLLAFVVWKLVSEPTLANVLNGVFSPVGIVLTVLFGVAVVRAARNP